jgi:hypothetical protein
MRIWCIYLISGIAIIIAAQLFYEILTNENAGFSGLTGIVRARAVVLSLNVWCARRHYAINTSLSETLFF